MNEGDEAPDHNPIFDHFVKPDQSGDDQLQGLVAYALYKREKREWAATMWARKHQRPTAEQLSAYVDTITRPRLEGLSEQAKRIVDDYVSAYVEAAEPHIRAQALRGTFWTAVWPSVVATLIYSLALIAVVLILRWFGVDILGLLQKAQPASS